MKRLLMAIAIVCTRLCAVEAAIYGLPTSLTADPAALMDALDARAAAALERAMARLIGADQDPQGSPLPRQNRPWRDDRRAPKVGPSARPPRRPGAEAAGLVAEA